MTKWARMRRRKERKRAEEALGRSEAEGKEAKLAEPEIFPKTFSTLKRSKRLKTLKLPAQTQY